MPFLWKRKQVFREECDVFDVYAQFAGSGAEQISADADVVTKVEQFVKLKPFFAYRIFLYINLQSLPILLQVRKSRLAHQADGHNPAGNAYVYRGSFELLGIFRQVLRQNLRNCVGEFVLRRVRALAQSFNLLELVEPQLVDIFVESQRFPGVRKVKADYNQHPGMASRVLALVDGTMVPWYRWLNIRIF
jgi:hypothetical protein